VGLVEGISKSNTGLTKEEITTEVKLILLQNGIKSEKKSGDYLYINVDLLPHPNGINDFFNIDIKYRKFSHNHEDKIIDSNVTGRFFTPEQGNYGNIGIASNKKFIIESINKYLKKFILDYLESNIE
jgi:hypothetical protein